MHNPTRYTSSFDQERKVYPELVKNPAGRFVLFSDYEALRKEKIDESNEIHLEEVVRVAKLNGAKSVTLKHSAGKAAATIVIGLE